MSQQKGEVVVDGALAVMEVGVADPAGLNPDQRLAGTGIGHQDGDQLNRLACGCGNDSIHLMGH